MWRQLLDKFGEKAQVYNGIQQIVGSERVWNGFLDACKLTLENWEPSDVWLDLGCGTAEILDHLPATISYLGVDSNTAYIDFARIKYNDRPGTRFVCADWNDASWQALLNDQVLGIVSLLGLLHHLDSPDAKDVLKLSLHLVKKDGMVMTLDGCKEIHASTLERFFYWIDRGKYIRSATELQNLFPIEPIVSLHNNWLRVPYCYAICTVCKT